MPKKKPQPNPAFHDIDTIKGATERKPLSPIRFELFANAIVRNGGNIRRAADDHLDPLADPMFETIDDLPKPIRARVNYLLQRVAADTVATRREVEQILTFALRGDEDRGRGITRIEAARELCKMNGWYSPVEVKTTKEIVVPRQIADMSDDKLRRIAMLTANPSSAIEAEVIEVEEPIKEETPNEFGQ